MNQRNRLILLLPIFTLVCPAAADTPSTEIKDLLIQRIEVLQEIVTATKLQHEDALVGLADVVEASNELLLAKLDLASDAPSRIALRKEIVENLRNLEAGMIALHQQGGVPRQEVLRSRAARLEAEILLARERKQ